MHDALDRISDEIRTGKDAFKFYDEQRKCPIARDECADDPDKAANLERYMVLNIALRAWEQRPGKKWYVFADDDTYVFWPNLMHWLHHKAKRRSDPFVGSVVMLSGFPFAHGGSGFVLSGAAIEKMVADIPEVSAKYNKLAQDMPYGNMVLAKALGEVGIVVKQAHPMFNGEKPSTVPFGRQHWCQPVFTMSGVEPEEISSAWHFEQERNETVSASPTTGQE